MRGLRLCALIIREELDILLPDRWQNKSGALLYMFLPNLMLLQQMKVGPVKGFKRLGDPSNVLDLSDINTSDLKPDT